MEPNYTVDELRALQDSELTRLIDELAKYRTNWWSCYTARDRINELMNLNTKLENDRRMLSAQLDAAKKILKFVLIDQPIAMDVATKAGMPTAAALRSDKDMYSLFQRIELLEKDAWTATSLETKEFVKDADIILQDPPDEETLLAWVSMWFERLKKSLG